MKTIGIDPDGMAFSLLKFFGFPQVVFLLCDVRYYHIPVDPFPGIVRCCGNMVRDKLQLMNHYNVGDRLKIIPWSSCITMVIDFLFAILNMRSNANFFL